MQRLAHETTCRLRCCSVLDHLWQHTHTVMMQAVAAITFLPARTQRASRSTALVSLRPRSMRRASSLAFSVGRPGSKLGDAIGLNSTLNLKDPSFGLTKQTSQFGYQQCHSRLDAAVLFQFLSLSMPGCIANQVNCGRYLSGYGASSAAVTTDKTRVCPKRTVQLLSSSVYWKDTFR